MDKTEIRLDCVKLAITRTVSIDDAIEEAEKILAFVTKDAPSELPKPSGRGGKKSENAEIPP